MSATPMCAAALVDPNTRVRTQHDAPRRMRQSNDAEVQRVRQTGDGHTLGVQR
ncbi:hypothetical protein [Nocardia asiatica]